MSGLMDCKLTKPKCKKQGYCSGHELPTPASPGVDSVDEILKGVIAPYDKEGRHHHSWIVDELSIGEAKAALLAHALALLPKRKEPEQVQISCPDNKPGCLVMHYGYILSPEDTAFNAALDLWEQRLRESYR